MKFTLKDYQDEAVKEVLDRLKKAKKRWHEDKDKHAFSLTATTGAGKTVMAAAVFESLFFGNDDYEFEPDPSAVVIWFSDDPSLNEQSRWRLQEASDKLTVSDLVTVGNSFAADKFQAGKVYFLNTQKLSKNSLLVRGHDPSDPALETSRGQMTIMPDMRQHTIWDVIRNTIDDPDLTLYLVLDEAHRGMKDGGRASSDGKPTIVKQLINGTGNVPGIPVVWGISATVQRFNDAVAGMQGRTTLPHVEVNAKKVQESGLLKDTINLEIPNESGDFSTVLLKRGAAKLRDISEAWKQYSEQQNDADTVLPLMVLQVPNSPDPKEIGTWLDTIFKEWPELPIDSVANVFGEHKTEEFGGYMVPYISPERVQESEWVRILIAKDAISTGWDCPRAEVMVSFRRATDKTHITQLLGRMVRTPLARRIPGNDRLNAVDCLLPQFDKKSVTEVVTQLRTGESGEELPERRILINSKEMLPNPAIPKEVWDLFTTLPSQTLPKRQTRPIKRLTALAHELAADDLLKDAGKKAHALMHKVLDKAQTKYAKDIKASRSSVLTVEGKAITADVETLGMTFDDFVESADMAVIEDAYRSAARILSPDLATSYSEHLAKKFDDIDDEEEKLIEAHTEIASLGLVLGVKNDLEAAAGMLANEWLEEFRPRIKKLSDERQDVYRQIREMSAEPLDVDLAVPKSWLQATIELKPNGKEEKLPHYPKHLLCDEEGNFPFDHNSWEEKVITTELKNPELVGWYRNPSRASQESLGITYEDGGETYVLRPDFIFFYKQANGKVVADIIDPHGDYLGDALEKIKGTAKYVTNNTKAFRRVLVCSEIDREMVSVDLAEKEVREAVVQMSSIQEVYQASFARNYR